MALRLLAFARTFVPVGFRPLPHTHLPLDNSDGVLYGQASRGPFAAGLTNRKAGPHEDNDLGGGVGRRVDAGGVRRRIEGRRRGWYAFNADSNDTQANGKGCTCTTIRRAWNAYVRRA